MVINQYMQLIKKIMKLKNWNKINFFPVKNYTGFFYCPCTEQHDLCIIHCTLHINLSNIFARYKIPVYNFNSYIKFENCNMYHISDTCTISLIHLNIDQFSKNYVNYFDTTLSTMISVTFNFPFLYFYTCKLTLSIQVSSHNNIK